MNHNNRISRKSLAARAALFGLTTLAAALQSATHSLKQLADMAGIGRGKNKGTAGAYGNRSGDGHHRSATRRFKFLYGKKYPVMVAFGRRGEKQLKLARLAA